MRPIDAGKFAGNALAVGLLCFVALACGKRQAGTGAGGAETLPAQQATARVEETPGSGFRVLSSSNTMTSMTLQLRWEGEPPGVTETRALGFCLPPGLQARATWLEATLDGEPLRIGTGANRAPANGSGEAPGAPQLSPYAGSVQYLGILRHWPVYRLTLSRDVFEAMRRADDGAIVGRRRGKWPQYDLTLQIAWNQDVDRPDPVEVAEPSDRSRRTWRRIAESLVLNKQDLDRFAVVDAPWPNDLPQAVNDLRALADGDRTWARLRIASEGLARVETRELQRVGFPAAGLRAEDVRVFSHGEAVPLLIAPGEGIPAGAPPGVYFWARGGDGPYMRERVYWVTVAPDVPAARLATAQIVPKPEEATRRTFVPRRWKRDLDEVFRTRHGRFMAFLGMRWVEAPLDVNQPVLLPVQLPWMAAEAGDPKLTLNFFVDRERSMHGARVDVGADAKTRESLQFSSADDTSRDIDLSAGAFHDGATTLSLLIVDVPQRTTSSDGTPDDGHSGLWFDNLAVNYPSLPRLVDGRLTIDDSVAGDGTVWIPLPDIDASDGPPIVALRVDASGEAQSLHPIERRADGQGAKEAGLTLTGTQGGRVEVVDVSRLAESPRLERVQTQELIASETPCDLLIVTHETFRAQAERLAEHRRSQGWGVRVVDVQSVYDQFSDGETSPPAIRAMLAHALRDWPAGPPSDVLLIGDTTADYLGEARNGVTNFVPTYVYRSGGDAFASDYWFSTVTGDDPLADFTIGRLSVADREDAEAVVDKLIAYDTGSKPGPWRARIGYVADHGEFPSVLDGLRTEETPEAYAARRVFLDEYPMEDNWYLALQLVESKDMKVSTQATQDILKIFREGVSFLSYYGHGSPNIWSNERMWFGGGSVNSDNLLLEGSGVYSFVANMTCNSGAIDYPLTPWNICITEDLMRVRDGGAIACYVPSGPSVTMVHRRMSEALQSMLFIEKMRSLGELVTAAKARYLLNGNPDELAFMYLLLGDPLTRLQMTEKVGRIDLPSPTASPGSSLRLTLNGLSPAPGRWTGELVTGQNDRLWSGQGETAKSGAATLTIDVPTTAPAGRTILKLYCWQGGAGSAADEDLALSANLRIETPYLQLGDVRVASVPEGGLNATIEIANPTKLAGRGELTVWVEDASGSHSLLNEPVEGAGQRSVSLSKAIAEPADETSGPVYLGARLRSARLADEAALPQTTVRRVLLRAPGRGAAGFLPRLCVLEEDPRIRQGTLRLTAYLTPAMADALTSGAQLAVGVDDASSKTLASANLELAAADAAAPHAAPPGMRLATGQIRLEDVREETLEGALLWLGRRAAGHAGGRGERIESLSLARIGRVSPDLWIPPDSIRVRPQRPMEGETVFIDCTVANRGNLASAAASVRLLDSPPWEGAHPAASNARGGSTRVPALGSGREQRVTLRWDPVKNLGERKLWIQLMGRPGQSDREADDQVREVTVAARSKPEPALGRSWIDASERDKRYHRVRIHAEVLNRGQSDARKVMVAFYRSRVQVDENKLGEVLLETVPAEGSAVASYEWNYDPRKDLVRGGELPKPTVKVWLKGSVRPPISDVEETPGEAG
jgi:hypothetical protein